MKNVTITLEEEVARWARIQAAEKNTSVSRLVGDLLKQFMAQEQAYERAMKSHRSRRPIALKSGADAYPARAELHVRDRFR